MSFIDVIKERAKQDKKTIVLPEAEGRLLLHPKRHYYQLENTHEQYNSSCHSQVSMEYWNVHLEILQ